VQKAFNRTHLRYPRSRSQLLFNLNFAFSVSMLQLIVLRKHPHCTTRSSSQSHSQLSLLPSLCRHCHHYYYPPRSTELIPTVLHHVVLQISPLHRCPMVSPSPIHVCTKSSIHVSHVAFAKNPLCHHLSLSSYPLALILSLFTHIFLVVLYIHVTNHSIQALQELGP